MAYEYNNYLAHHGVKGQKWGVRRYQNEDGTPKNTKKLGLIQRLTHDKKEGMKQKALEENNYKKQYHSKIYDDWKKKKKEYRV